MAKEIIDINKSMSTICLDCNFKNNCPYTDKSQCIEVRSSSGEYYDTETYSSPISEKSNEDLQ